MVPETPQFHSNRIACVHRQSHPLMENPSTILATELSQGLSPSLPSMTNHRSVCHFIGDEVKLRQFSIDRRSGSSSLGWRPNPFANIPILIQAPGPQEHRTFNHAVVQKPSSANCNKPYTKNLLTKEKTVCRIGEVANETMKIVIPSFISPISL